jgi:putative Mn2+ efflux pump MntP
MLALLLVAFYLGLDNLAACIGIGVSGVDTRTRLRVGLAFGLFETAMPILGLLLGHGLATALGHAAHWVGAGLLIAAGLYAVIQALRQHSSGDGSAEPGEDSPSPRQTPDVRTGRLLVTGAALSIDNLAVGFALGSLRVSIAVAVIVIGAVSIIMSLIGLELGSQIGSKIGERGEVLGGLVLTGVGIALAAGVI